MDVGDEAKPGVIIGMVEDQAVSLALSRAQTATDHLHEQYFGFRGPRQDDGAHVPVDAGG